MKREGDKPPPSVWGCGILAGEFLHDAPSNDTGQDHNANAQGLANGGGEGFLEAIDDIGDGSINTRGRGLSAGDHEATEAHDSSRADFGETMIRADSGGSCTMFDAGSGVAQFFHGGMFFVMSGRLYTIKSPGPVFPSAGRLFS